MCSRSLASSLLLNERLHSPMGKLLAAKAKAQQKTDKAAGQAQNQ